MEADLDVYVPPMMGPIDVFLLAAAGVAVETTSAPLAEISRKWVKSARPLHTPTTNITLASRFFLPHK